MVGVLCEVGLFGVQFYNSVPRTITQVFLYGLQVVGVLYREIVVRLRRQQVLIAMA